MACNQRQNSQYPNFWIWCNQNSESLPRTPSEAGIVPVSLKRKIEYKRSHKTQYVSVPKILQALNSLKSLGNPYYQFVPNIEDFSARCKENDADGFQLFFSDDGNPETEEILNTETDVSKKRPSEQGNQCFNAEPIEKKEESENEIEKEEEEYRKKDCVKKWQFDYNKSICFTNDYPEIGYKEEHDNEDSVAPGEGKTP